MSGVALGIGRGSPMQSVDADWLLRDEFVRDLAAGSVNGTAAEPGPGTRTAFETDGQWSISLGKLQIPSQATATWGDLDLVYPSVSRVAGRMLFCGLSLSTISNIAIGFNRDADPTTPALDNDAAVDLSSGLLYVRHINRPLFPVAPVLTSTNYSLLIALRSTGSLFFIRDSVWKLLWIESINAVTPLYPYISNYRSVGTADYIRVPDALWLPTPLASDGFGSTFGTTDGLGHPEGIAGGIGAGGSGLTWSNAGSTWSVSGGKAINTAPSGLSQQISVLNASKADVFVSAALTRSAAEVGLVLNMDSASSPANGVLVYLDGTNCKIDKIVAGVTSNVRTTAVTYSAGARLVVAKNGSEYRVYYNNALVGAANTISDAGIVSNTLHGLFSTDASNTLDDLTIYATGTGGEYAELDKWS